MLSECKLYLVDLSKVMNFMIRIISIYSLHIYKMYKMIITFTRMPYTYYISKYTEFL